MTSCLCLPYIQVLTWVKQHEQRLERALEELQKDTVLLQDLQSWLQWAESRLAQREAAPLPQQPMQLRALISEHYVGLFLIIGSFSFGVLWPLYLLVCYLTFFYLPYKHFTFSSGFHGGSETQAGRCGPDAQELPEENIREQLWRETQNV